MPFCKIVSVFESMIKKMRSAAEIG